MARPQVWIENPGHATRAQEIVAAYLQPAPPGPAQRCPKCAEENPSSFDICWACGSPLA